MPKIKHLEAFTHVLVNRNFDEDSIKSEQARMDKSLSHYKSMGYFFRHSTANFVVSGMNLTKFGHIQDFVHVYVTCMFKKDRINSSKMYSKIRN